MDIQFALEADLSVDEFLDLLHRSTLAARRPVHDRATIEAMLRGASLILTARSPAALDSGLAASPGLLVGVSRAISDFAYCTYLSDLAVDVAYQRRGIGRQLIRHTHVAGGLQTTLVLLSAPKARSYYPHVGMEAHESCWIQRPQLNSSTDLSAAPSPGLPDAAGTHATIDRSSIVVPRGPRGATPGKSHDAPGEATTHAAVDTATTADRLEHFFDQLASDYDQAIRRCFPRYGEMLDNLLSYLPPSDQPSRILELGCGTGNLTVRLSERYPQSRITAVDISHESLAACRRRIADGDSSRFDFHPTDMRQLRFDSDQFDLIVSTIAIHHLTSQEKQQLFSNAFRWLCPGGKLIFADQCSAESLRLYDQHMRTWRQISLAAGASEEEWSSWMEHQREHDHHDTARQQLDWLVAAGFGETDVLWRYLLWTILHAAKAS